MGFNRKIENIDKVLDEETWHLTNELRYYKVVGLGGHATTELQQKWISSTGNEKWLSVKYVIKH